MANGGGSLQQFCEDIKCSKCNNYPAVPITLPCFHTFCRGCLANLTDAEKEQLPCHECRDTLQIPVDVDKLDTNFCFENFLYYARKDRETTSSRRAAQCGRCTRNDRTVNTFCTVCRMDLCDLCTTDHRAVPATSGHALTPKVPNGSQHGRWFCSKHKDGINNAGTLAEIQYYCRHCDKVICNTCIVTGEHEGHAGISTVNDAYESQHPREQIETSFQTAAGVRDTLVTAVGGLEDLKRSAATSLENVKQGIQEKVKQLHEMLEEEGKKMMERADGIFAEKMAHLNEQIKDLGEIQDKFEHSKKITKGALAVGEAEDILYLKKQLISRLEGLSQTYQNHDCAPKEDDVILFTENIRTERTRAQLRNAIGTVSPEFFIPDMKDRLVDDQYFASQL